MFSRLLYFLHMSSVLFVCPYSMLSLSPLCCVATRLFWGEGNPVVFCCQARHHKNLALPYQYSDILDPTHTWPKFLRWRARKLFLCALDYFSSTNRPTNQLVIGDERGLPQAWHRRRADGDAHPGAVRPYPQDESVSKDHLWRFRPLLALDTSSVRSFMA